MKPETFEGMSERLASGTACTSHSRPLAMRLPSGFPESSVWSAPFMTPLTHRRHTSILLPNRAAGRGSGHWLHLAPIPLNTGRDPYAR